MKAQTKTSFIADGYYSMCNAFGIEVQINSAGNAVRYRKSESGNEKKPSKWQPIKFMRNGRAYFRVKNQIIFLELCLRVC